MKFLLFCAFSILLGTSQLAHAMKSFDIPQRLGGRDNTADRVRWWMPLNPEWSRFFLGILLPNQARTNNPEEQGQSSTQQEEAEAVDRNNRGQDSTSAMSIVTEPAGGPRELSTIEKLNKVFEAFSKISALAEETSDPEVMEIDQAFKSAISITPTDFVSSLNSEHRELVLENLRLIQRFFDGQIQYLPLLQQVNRWIEQGEGLSQNRIFHTRIGNLGLNFHRTFNQRLNKYLNNANDDDDNIINAVKEYVSLLESLKQDR